MNHLTIENSKKFCAELDQRMLKLAREIGNPVLSKYLQAVYAETPEEALAIIDEKITVKDNVYFLADDYEGEGIVYRDDIATLKVYAPATQKMYTVDRELASKL